MQTLGFLLELAPGRHGLEQYELRRSSAAHPDARELLDYWNERGRALVMGEDLPSRRIARLLPNIAILDYRLARNDFRVRLAGFSLVKRFGRDIGRHYLSEVVGPAEQERLSALLMEARDGTHAVICDVNVHRAQRPVLHYEMLLLRALAVDRETALVLMSLFFFDKKGGGATGAP